jgi:hypothetical protein
MEGQKKPIWKNPGVVALVAAVVIGNFIVDVWLFKPENVIALLIADAAVVGWHRAMGDSKATTRRRRRSRWLRRCCQSRAVILAGNLR